MNPQELKSILSSGLLSFPVTDFNAQGDFNRAGYIKRLEWLAPYGASALFAAGGTGEFFSLAASEYSEIIKTAVDTCATSVPILAGVGGSTRQAIEYAQEAERLGAKGLLLLPHYLTEASQDRHTGGASVDGSLDDFRVLAGRQREKLTGAARGEQRRGTVWGQPLETLDVARTIEVALSVEIGDRERQQTGREDGLQFLWIHYSNTLDSDVV